MNPDIPLTDYLFDDSVFTDYECTAENLEKAGTVALETEKWAGQIIGYPGGQCEFVRT